MLLRKLILPIAASLIVAFADATPAFANMDTPEIRRELRIIIISKDYVCNHVNRVFGPTATHRGTELRIQCDGGNFLYRVTITPSRRFIVEPR